MRREMDRMIEAMRDDELADRSARAARRLGETAAWTWMDTLLAFLSMPREIATGELIRAAHAEGKSIAVPRIEAGEIRFLVMPPGAVVPPRAGRSQKVDHISSAPSR